MYDASGLLATTTSVSLLFHERPNLNFAAYVTRMEKALRTSFGDTMQLSWDHEDIVIIDIDGSRVSLGLWEAPEAGDESREGYEAAMVMSVGPGPDWRSETRIARFRKALCQSVVAGILERHPADLVLWKDLQGVYAPDDFEMLIDQAIEAARGEAVIATPAAMADPGASGLTMQRAEAAARALGERRFGGVPVRRLMDRLATEIPETAPMRLPDMPKPLAESADAPQAEDGPSAMETAARDDFRSLVANDLPDLPRPDVDQLDRIRGALYPADPDDGKPVLAHRLAIYAANTTLMLVALPVGAALMTYSVLGGEDARLTARAVALTGAVIGILHSSLGQSLLHTVSALT